MLTAEGALAEIPPIRYRGYYYDTETGYYFLQTRYYNSEWRRFLNADALFIAGDMLTGSNMYAYCNGNPVMLVDPSGMAGEDNIWDLFGVMFVLNGIAQVILDMVPPSQQPDVVSKLNSFLSNFIRPIVEGGKTIGLLTTSATTLLRGLTSWIEYNLLGNTTEVNPDAGFLFSLTAFIVGGSVFGPVGAFIGGALGVISSIF